MVKRRRKPEARLVANLKCHLEKRGMLTATELGLGHGRADLVAFSVDPSKCQTRFNNGQLRSLDRIEHYSLLRLIPEVTTGKIASLEDLSRRLNFSESYLRTELVSFLMRFHYVIEVQPKKYAKLNGFVPVADEIWAIEVKVKDWKKGAIQAKRYQAFANRVFLAISKDYIHRVDPKILTRHRIGLLSIGNEISEEIPAPKQQPRNIDRFAFAAEWIWRYKRGELREFIHHAS